MSKGGGYINGVRIESFDQVVDLDYFQEGKALLRAGKKRYHKILIV